MFGGFLTTGCDWYVSPEFMSLIDGPGEVAFPPPCRESRLEWWSSSWALWPR